jgi:HEAT repeat protein
MIKRVLLALALPLVALAERPIDDLLLDATRYGNTPERREAKRAAQEELKARMPESLRAAMRWAHSDNVMMHVLIYGWVESQPAEVVVPVLLEFINDQHEATRRAAIFFLGFHPVPEHADLIMPHLENDETRGVTLRTLGKWKVPATRAIAEKILQDGHERQRVVAANALRDLGDPAAIPALTGALEDPVFTVRNTAARAILALAGEDKSLIPDGREGQLMIERIRMDAGLAPPDESILVEGGFFR